MGSDASLDPAMHTASPHRASVFVGDICRHDARQEPGTVVPYAGICGGGGPQWPSLLRSHAKAGCTRGELASGAATGGGGPQAPPTRTTQRWKTCLELFVQVRVQSA